MLAPGNDAAFREALATRAPAIRRAVSESIVVTDDEDFRDFMGAKAMSDFFGNILATTYPGYRWYIEPHPHPTHPFVDVRLEAGGGPLGFTVCLKNHYSASELKRFIIMQGGETLERHGMNRRRFDEVEFLTRPRDFAGLALPHLDGVKGV